MDGYKNGPGGKYLKPVVLMSSNVTSSGFGSGEINNMFVIAT